MMSLSNDERNSLENIIVSIYGRDHNLTSIKPRYNEYTVQAVEGALSAAVDCNSNMKELLKSLIGGYRVVARNWLKNNLRAVEKALDSERVKLDGFACRVVGLSRWKSEIVHSTYR
jgi:hypothetical protein